jgi:hypothetical protein
MKAMLIKTEKGLRGATEEDHAAYCKFKRRLQTMTPGKWLRLEWATPRNGPHHRKFMALVQLVTENSETYDTVEKALVAIKLAAAYFDPHIDPSTGEIIKVPQSISYDAMEQGAFDQFYEAALTAICGTVVPQLDRETADRLLQMIQEGWA